MAPTSTLPTEDVPIKMDPDLSAAVSGLLELLPDEPREDPDDEDLELPSLRALGKEAVMAVYRSGFAGVFSELVAHYRKAIEEATGEDLVELQEEAEEVAA